MSTEALRPQSLDLQIEDTCPSYDEAPPIVRIRSKSALSPTSKRPSLSVSCCLTPKTRSKRRSFEIVIERRRLQQQTHTTISIDFTWLRILVVLACCLSSACGLVVVPAATRAGFEPRRLALASGTRSRLPIADVASLHMPQPSLLDRAPAAFSHLGEAAKVAASEGRLDFARAAVSQQYRVQHALLAQPRALVQAPLTKLSGWLLGAMFPVRHRAIHEWHDERAALFERELAIAESLVETALRARLGAAAAGRVHLKSRVKSTVSIFDKAVLRGKPVRDVLGVRLVVDAAGAAGDEQCYAAAETLRALWPDGHVRVKDYIASPKRNGYRSLHALVTTSDETQIEFQIRTAEMQQQAEAGSAAHALYKADANDLSTGRGWTEHRAVARS